MMRKAIILFSLLFLVACGSMSPLNDDFEMDVDQVLPIIKEAHDNQEEFSEQENELINSFIDKYEKGQYIPNGEDEYYEMNDLEKAVFHNIRRMSLFAIDIVNDSVTLASETVEGPNLYEQSEEELNKILKINDIEDLPEDLIGKYPTYEVYDGMYPERFEKDAKALIDLFDPVVNGNQYDVDQLDYYQLIYFLEDYQTSDIYPREYEQEGKHYLINDAMRDVISMVTDLEEDLKSGGLRYTTIDKFNSVKEDLEIYGIY